MTSLITGGTGFIGAEVVRLLLEKGENPVIFSRNPSGPRLADLVDKVDGIAGDLGNFSNVLNAWFHTGCKFYSGFPLPRVTPGEIT